MNSWPSAGCPSANDLQGDEAPPREAAAAEPPAISLWPGLLATAGLLCLFAAGALILRQSLTPNAFRIAEPVSHAEREAGFALYRAHCSACHGAFLAGAAGWRTDPSLAPALNESGHSMNHGDAELFRRVVAGARGPDGRVTMPAFRNLLSDAEIVSVLAYVQSWWPEAELRRRAGPDWIFSGICSPGQTEAEAPAKAGS